MAELLGEAMQMGNGSVCVYVPNGWELALLLWLATALGVDAIHIGIGHRRRDCARVVSWPLRVVDGRCAIAVYERRFTRTCH